MLRSLTLLRRAIANPKIVHSPREFRNDPKIDFYPIVGLKESKTGAILLNKPENNNVFTEECLDELFRFFATYHHDRRIETVWIQHRGDHFSSGVDYEELVQSEVFLQKLYKFILLLGRFNKPVYTKIDGSVLGIATYILTMFSNNLATKRASLKIDDLQRGFIPIIGGTHRIHQFPLEVGIYLALTGEKLTVNEMRKMNLIKGEVRREVPNKQLRDHLNDANLKVQMPYSPNLYSDDELSIFQRTKQKKESLEQRVYEVNQYFVNMPNFFAKIATQKYNMSKVLLENIRNPVSSFSEKGKMAITNYFQLRKEKTFNYLVKQGLITEQKYTSSDNVNIPFSKIMKIFCQPSLQKIFQALEKDGSEWAKKTCQKIRNNDPLATILTFNLLQKTKDLEWAECLEMEYAVARRLLDESKFEIQTTQQGSRKILKNAYSDKTIEDIPSEVIERFFDPNRSDRETLEHKIIKKSFIPNCDFAKYIPDVPRYYLNETFYNDMHNDNSYIDVYRFHQLNKIDYRDWNYNLKIVREKVFDLLKDEKNQEKEEKRIQHIVNDKKFLEEFIAERKKVIDEEFQNPKIEEEIADIIKQQMENRFDGSFENLYKTSEIAGKEKRLQIFKNYRETFIQNVIFNGEQIQKKNSQKNLKATGFVYFDKQGRSLMEGENHHMKQNIPAIQQLEKEVKRGFLSQQYVEKYGDEVRPEFFDRSLQETQLKKGIRLERERIQERYGYTTECQQNVKKHQFLIQRAAQSSEAVAAFLGWSEEDIDSIITNAPKEEISIVDLGNDIINEHNEHQRQRVQVLKEATEEYKREKQNLQEEKEKKINILKEHIPFVFDKFNIPKPFREVFMNLLHEVLYYFNERYLQNEKFPTFEKNTYLDKIAKEGLSSDYTEFLKHDVIYVYSYLGIVYLKNIFYTLQKKKNLLGEEKQEQLKKYLRKIFNLHFGLAKRQQINKDIMSVLYLMLDMHADAKEHLIFPETKILDFINRTEHNFEQHQEFSKDDRDETGRKSVMTMMYLIAKDRKILRNYEENGKQLSFEIQNIRSLLEYEKQGDYKYLTKANYRSIYKTNPLPENFKDLELMKAPKSKKLVDNFRYYLLNSEVMIYKLLDKDIFLPRQWREENNKEVNETLKNILPLKITHKEWFKQMFRKVINILLDFRQNKEKQMSKGELKLFDQDFLQLFSLDVLKAMMKVKLDEEYMVGRKMYGKRLSAKEEKQKFMEKLTFELKGTIVNRKALKIFNNLRLAEEMQYKEKKIEDGLFSKNEEPSYETNEYTIKRLMKQITTLPDQQDKSWENPVYQRLMLGRNEDFRKSSEKIFFNEFKQISKVLKNKETDYMAKLISKLEL